LCVLVRVLAAALVRLAAESLIAAVAGEQLLTPTTLLSRLERLLRLVRDGQVEKGNLVLMRVVAVLAALGAERQMLLHRLVGALQTQATPVQAEL
jgi:hypothetical protein